MYKELAISIVILISIFGLNKITEDNTSNTVETMKSNLEIVRQDIIKKEPNKEDANRHMEEAYQKWEEYDDSMAFYIEHDELEKVKTALTSSKSFVESEEYEQAIECIDRCVYILEHIEEREKLSLDNIF